MEQYESFNRIYYETKQQLLRWLIPRVKDSNDIEDLAQEIYRKLYQAMRRKLLMKDPSRYLFGIAKNELARFYRGRAVKMRNEEPLTDLLADEEPLIEEQIFQKERIKEAWEIVASEPLTSYQAFTLYYGFDVPTTQIAKELGISESAVRTRLSRTRARIRNTLIEQDSCSNHPTEKRNQL